MVLKTVEDFSYNDIDDDDVTNVDEETYFATLEL
jgi:hypothetical protein